MSDRDSQTTTPNLPKGWKISKIEASDGKRRMSIDFTRGEEPQRAVERIIEMMRDFL
jgi:hypothetical protein